MSLSTITRLNDDNYAEWVMGIEALFTRKGLWEVTSAPTTDTHPNGSDNMKAVRSWRAKIAEACTELILNIELTQYAHVQSTDAHEVWSELYRVHLARSFGTRLTHHHAFWHISKCPDQSMNSWIADVRCATFRLKEIDASIDDEDRILALTNGLPDSYSQLVVNLDSTPPSDLTLDYIITRLLNEESRQLSLASTSGTLYDTALSATMKPRTPLERITCFKCSKKGHYQHDCPQLKNDSDEANMVFVFTAAVMPKNKLANGPVVEDDVAW